MSDTETFRTQPYNALHPTSSGIRAGHETIICSSLMFEREQHIIRTQSLLPSTPQTHLLICRTLIPCHPHAHHRIHNRVFMATIKSLSLASQAPTPPEPPLSHSLQLQPSMRACRTKTHVDPLQVRIVIVLLIHRVNGDQTSP